MTHRIQPTRPQALPPQRTQPRQAPATSFANVLQDKLQSVQSGGVKLSAHASARLQESRRQLSPQDLTRIAHAVDQVQAKGGRESLLLMDNLALVVSVPNRTVITAVSGDRMRDNVFTNIDSAVIL